MPCVPAVTIRRLGHEAAPLVIIDDFSPDPGALVAAAAAQAFAPNGPYYPGIRAPADAGYLAARMDVLRPVLEATFDCPGGARLVECAFSLVTTLPQDLLPIQRLPHFDSTDPGRFALLHYLCGPEQGGTAFYRHRATGFESVSDARYPVYTAALEAEVAATGLPDADYIRGETVLFEQTGEVEAAFNRMVIYRSRTLHSGRIPPDFAFSPDPRVGRLTINTFLKAR